NRNLLTENRVTYLFESFDKTIWIATEDGLYHLDMQTLKVNIYSTKTGLPSNLIYTIVEDVHHNKWIATSKGLVLMNKESKILRIFTKADGLLSDQFNYSSCYIDKKGVIYLGGVKGLISFNPGELEINNYVPPVYLTSISS